MRIKISSVVGECKDKAGQARTANARLVHFLALGQVIGGGALGSVDGAAGLCKAALVCVEFADAGEDEFAMDGAGRRLAGKV